MNYECETVKYQVSSITLGTFALHYGFLFCTWNFKLSQFSVNKPY